MTYHSCIHPTTRKCSIQYIRNKNKKTDKKRTLGLKLQARLFWESEWHHQGCAIGTSWSWSASKPCHSLVTMMRRIRIAARGRRRGCRMRGENEKPLPRPGSSTPLHPVSQQQLQDAPPAACVSLSAGGNPPQKGYFGSWPVLFF